MKTKTPRFNPWGFIRLFNLLNSLADRRGTDSPDATSLLSRDQFFIEELKTAKRTWFSGTQKERLPFNKGYANIELANSQYL